MPSNSRRWLRGHGIAKLDRWIDLQIPAADQLQEIAVARVKLAGDCANSSVSIPKR